MVGARRTATPAGTSVLTRVADDGVLGGAWETDARRIMAVGTAVRPCRPDQAADENGADAVADTGPPRGVRPWDGHRRVPRIDPRLGAIAPGVVGDHTPDSQEAAPPHEEVVVAGVSCATSAPVNDQYRMRRLT